MEKGKKKSPGAVALSGFIVGVAGIIVSMVGIGKIGVSSKILEVPTGLFLLYLGFAIMLVGSIAWTIGVVKGWDDVPEDKSKAGLRVFGALPFVAGIITLLGGLRDTSEKTITLFGGNGTELMKSDMFLMIIGAAIAVIGLLIWFIGYKTSKVKTSILLRGSNARAKMFRDYRSELKKISWQSWKETYKQTGVVIASLIAIGIVVGVIDLVFLKGLNEWILNLIKG